MFQRNSLDLLNGSLHIIDIMGQHVGASHLEVRRIRVFIGIVLIFTWGGVWGALSIIRVRFLLVSFSVHQVDIASVLLRRDGLTFPDQLGGTMSIFDLAKVFSILLLLLRGETLPECLRDDT